MFFTYVNRTSLAVFSFFFPFQNNDAELYSLGESILLQVKIFVVLFHLQSKRQDKERICTKLLQKGCQRDYLQFQRESTAHVAKWANDAAGTAINR